MICPTCHTANAEGMKFCGECGTALVLRCAVCGASSAPGQKYCGECGSPLSASAAPAPASPVASGPAEFTAGAAEMRLVSVLFVDLVGFTALSESRDAADVRELLGRYFDSARTIVERYGGTIEKFIGDAVMAVWGAPVAREDDAERAVRAALDMVESVEVFGHEVGAPDLRARAGVVTGQVAALENPGEGLVVGDRVNTASRVQSAAQPGTVLVDEVTRGVTSASIFYEDAGEHSVKGKAEPLRLWHALRVVAGVAGNQREEGLEAPFVGREADLRLLKELFHQSLDRRTARLVAVSGEAGIGKSRLRREFFQYIDGLAGTVLWHSGRCLSYGEGVAYWALAEMVRQRFGIPEDAPPDEAGEKMAAGLGRWVPDPADREFLAPRLGALLGLGEPGLSREELSAGWRMFFDRLAAHEPVALVFEDLQWADPGLLEFIEQLLDWSSGSPIFILTLARPELAENHGGWPAGHRGATTLQLDPLGPAAMHELLAGVVPALPPGPSSRIVERAEGVPLYAIETVRALIDRGVLAEHEGSLVLRGEVGELDVPASLGSLLAARIDALEPGERQLVKAMSVFGGSFPRSTAAALSGVDAAELDRLLAGLVRKQVLAIRADPLSPDRGQYGFAQGLLRTVAYEMLSRQEQRARHVAAAQHLREAFPNEGEEVAEVIAHHLLDAYRAAQEDPGAAELRAETVVALRRAGNRAATVGAPETAMRNFLSARELAEEGGEWAEFTELAGSMAMLSGRSELALELLEAAAEANLKADRRREGARVAERIGEVLGRLGRLEEAATRCSEALEAFGADELHPDAGLLNHRLGRSRAYAGDYPGAIGPLERALQIAEALELPDLLATTLEAKGVIYGYTGRIREARFLVEGAISIAEPLGLTVVASRAHSNIGNICLQRDLLAEGESHFQASLGLARRQGDRYAESVAGGNLMTILWLAGRWDELLALSRELLEETPERAGGEFAQLGSALAYVHQGRLVEAEAAIAGVATWQSSDDLEYRLIHRAIVVSAAAVQGHHELALSGAQEILGAGIETLSAASDPIRLSWPAGVGAALHAGRLDAAQELVQALEGLPPGHIPPYLRAELIRFQAQLAAAESRHETVEPDLIAAVEAFRTLGYPYHVALVQTDLAEWLFSQSRTEEASVLLDDALATFRRLRAQPAIERAERLADQLLTAPTG